MLPLPRKSFSGSAAIFLHHTMPTVRTRCAKKIFMYQTRTDGRVFRQIAIYGGGGGKHVDGLAGLACQAARPAGRSVGRSTATLN